MMMKRGCLQRWHFAPSGRTKASRPLLARVDQVQQSQGTGETLRRGARWTWRLERPPSQLAPGPRRVRYRAGPGTPLWAEIGVEESLGEIRILYTGIGV